MKTIYARLGDLSMGETLDDGTTLGNLSGTLEKIGVQVLDNAGSMRDMGDILEDLMDKWNTFDVGQKQALAVKLAGKYQYNRLMALMENSEMYNEMMEQSANSDGFLQRTQEIYMESLEAKMQSFTASWEKLISQLFDPESIKPMIDSLTQVVNLLADMVSSIGGGDVALQALGATATSVFSNKIASVLVNTGSNLGLRNLQLQNAKAQPELLKSLGITSEAMPNSKGLIDYVSGMAGYTGILSERQQKQYSQSIDTYTELLNKQIDIEKEISKRVNSVNSIYGKVDSSFKDLIKFNKKTGELNTGEYDKYMHLDAAGFNITKQQMKNIDLGDMDRDVQTTLQHMTTLQERFVALENSGKQSMRVTTAGVQSSVDQINSLFENLSGKYGQLFDSISQKWNDFAVKNFDPVDGQKYRMISSSNAPSLIEYMNSIMNDVQNIGTSVGEGYTGDASKLVEEAKQLTSALQETVTQIESVDKATTDFLNEVRLQQIIGNVVDLTGGLGLLYSSLQSISNLPSIFSNSDLSAGEKFGKIIEAIVFILPTLIGSIATLRSSTASLAQTFKAMKASGESLGFDKLTQRLRDFKNELIGTVTGMRTQSTAATQSAAANTAAAGAIAATGTAAKTASVGVRLLSSAFAFLSNPLVGIAVMLGGIVASIITGVNEAKKADEEAKRLETVTQGTTAQTQLENVNEQRKAYEKLYDQFKDTGVVTDELRDAFKDFAETLGVSIETDNLKADSIKRITDALNEQADALSAVEQKQMVDAINTLMYGPDVTSHGYAIDPEPFNEFYHRFSKDTDPELVGTSRANVRLYSGNPDNMLENGQFAGQGILASYSTIGLEGYIDGTSWVERVRDTEEAISKIDTAVKELNVQLAAETDEFQQQALQAEIDVLTKQRDEIASWMSSEDVDKAINLQRSLAMNAVEGYDLTQFDNAKEATEALWANNYIKDYATVLGYDAGSAWLDGILSSVFDNSGEIRDALIGVGATKQSAEYYQDISGRYFNGNAVGSTVFNNGFGSTVGLAEFAQTMDAAGIDVNSLAGYIAVAESNGLDLGIALQELLTNTELQSALIKKDIEATERIVSKKQQQLADQAKLDKEIQGAQTRLITFAKMNGENLSEEDASQKVAEAYDLIYSSALDVNEQNELWAKYISDPSIDVQAAIAEMLTGFKKISGASRTLNASLETIQKSIFTNQIKKGSSVESARDRANTAVANSYDIFGEDALSEIVEAAPDDADWDMLFAYAESAIADGIHPDVIKDGIISGFEKGDFSVDSVTIYNEGDLATEDAQYVARNTLKGQIALGRQQYYNDATGNATREDIQASAEEIIAYGESLGLSLEQIKSVGDFSRPVEKVKKELENLALGLEKTADVTRTVYDNLVSAGYGGDNARFYANAVGGMSTKSQSTLSSSGYLSSGNEEDLIKLLNIANGNEGLAVEIAAHFSPEQLAEEIDGLNREDILPTLEVKMRLANGASIIEDLENDTVNNDSFEGLLNTGVYDIFDTAADQSQAFAETIGLLSDQSFEAQTALIGIDQAIEQMDYARQIDQLDDLAADLEKLKDGDLSDITIETQAIVDEKGIDGAIDDIQTKLDNANFVLDVNVGGDLIDTSHSLVEAMEDVADAASLIDDSWQVSVDNLEQLSSVFPGILQNAQDLGNGIYQIDQEIGQSAIDAATTSTQASAAEQAAKLEAWASYAETMQQNYAEQAMAYAQLADTNVSNDTDAQNVILQNQADATKTTEEYYQEQGTAAGTLASNEAGFSEDSATSMAMSMASADSSIAGNFNSMQQNAYVTMSNIQAMAAAAAAQVAEVGKENPIIGSVPQLVSGLGGAGTGSIATKEIRAGDTITIGGVPITVGGSTEQLGAAQKALEMQAMSEAYGSGAARARAAAAALLGKGNQLQNQLGNVGKGSGSGGSGGSGGGSGSGGDAYEPKQVEITESELDRYEKVDTALDSISQELSKLEAEQERLTGKNLLKNLEKQVELLNQQVDIQKEKLAIQKEELAEYDKRLADEFGVTFAENGLVTNYKERFEYYLGYLNELERQYNAATTEEAQEAIQEQIDAAKDALDTYESLIDKRDELFSNSIRESEKLIEDYKDQVEDLMIDTFNKSVDTIGSIKELNDTLAELHQIGKGLRTDNPFREIAVLLEKIDKFNNAGAAKDAINDIIAENRKKIASGVLTDDQVKSLEGINQIYKKAADSGATSIADMYAQAGEVVKQEIAMYKETGKSGIFGENEAAMYEAAETILNGLAEAMQEEEEMAEELSDKMVDAIDYQSEKIEQQLSLYEEVNRELEHQYNLIEKTRGENAYDDLISNIDAQRQNNIAQIEYHKKALDYYTDMLDKVEEGSDAWWRLTELINDTNAAIDDLVESTVDLAKQMQELATNKALDNMMNDILGTDLDWAQEQWELINRNADQYLDNVNAAYETQKLQGKYMDLLDGSNNLATQRKITQQMNEQLGYLREKEKLSEYDLAYANAQLEILQKQIALEEAQRNKSQMKLRRDSQGNYSYVYTADDNNIKSAQDELLDAQNNAYNLTKDNIVNVQSDMFSALADAQQKILDIQNQTELSQEEKAKRIKEIVDRTVEYIEGLSEQLGESNKHIVSDFVGMVQLMGEENTARLQDTYDQVINGNDDALTQVDERFNTSYTDALENIDGITDAFNDMYDELIDVNQEYEDIIQDALEKGGDEYDDYTDHLKDCIDVTNELVDSTREFYDILKDESGIMTQAQDTLGAYAAAIADVNNKYNAQVAIADDLRKQIADLQQENANLSNALLIGNDGSQGEWTDAMGNGNATGNPGDGSGFGGSGYGEDDLAWGIAQAIWTYGESSGWGNDPIRNGLLSQIYGDVFAQKVQGIINANAGNDAPLINYDALKKFSTSVLGFDTGGYTGTWFDNQGRLAMLHQKELVLNASDTQNILAAVDAVRSVASSMKAGAFDSIVTNIRDYANIFDKATMDSNSLEQNIHIDADFPNVYNAEDIRDALLGLGDTAAQYANSINRANKLRGSL